jgi:predicted PurR-regulated permease PerM
MANDVPAPHDLSRTLLSVLFLTLLLASTFWILRPFLAALLWGATIVASTWPMRVRLVGLLRGRTTLAVTLLTLALLLTFMVPLFLTIGTLIAHSDEIATQVKSVAAGGIPAAPGWLAKVPLVGSSLAGAWDTVAASPLSDLTRRLTPYVGDVAAWFAGTVGGLGRLLMQFLLTVVVAAVLWTSGEAWAAALLRFARKLGGSKGDEVVRLAGQAVRAVALGVVVTAVVQAVLGGIGLAIAGIPFASILTVVMFLLAIAQLGPLPILLPAVAWLYLHDASGWGTFLLIWSVVVGTLDNFLRPALIRRGADLPLLLVFAGVLGGLVSFGLVGLFVGPVVLAVARNLLNAWLGEIPGTTVEAAPT